MTHTRFSKIFFPVKLILVLLLPFFVGVLLALRSPVLAAQSGTYESYNVDVVINKDSSFDVTETVTNTFTGTFHYITRGITLTDSATTQYCQSNPAAQCGGFDYLTILGVYDGNGTKVPDSEYTLQNVDQNGVNQMLITWNFAPNGQVFNNEIFKYAIKYRVFGGLGYFSDYNLFYWNMLPENRPAAIKQTTSTITFPAPVNFTQSALRVLNGVDSASFDYSYAYNKATNTITLSSQNIAPDQNYTVLAQFPKNIVDQPAQINITSEPNPIDVTVNGVTISDVVDKISGIIPGSVELTFSKSGYIDQSMTLQLTSGQTQDVSVTLEQNQLTKILAILNIICGVCGCLIAPAGIAFLWLRWRNKGRDRGRKATIIPYYTPPEGVRPYLLGSVKDEKVDTIDITGTLIDLAYRGYFKIREFTSNKFLGFGGNKDYEFIKQKDFGSANESEQLILNSVFNYKDRVTMSVDLKESFYLKIPALKDHIYQEMVTLKYFDTRPDQVRDKYIGIGIVLIVIGAGALCGFGFMFTVYAVLTISISLILLGAAFLIFANFMPAKTELGSSILEQILGFRMYMYTAERFRVQDLTPETFEKYLSYAIVFGIEKQWGERFKDIYKVKPDWFEGDNMTAWNTIYLVNALSSFNTVSASALTSRPASSSSGFSGGGFSGGGGFGGGFGGGGGGGGSSGWG
jgi:hypothetical protein